MKIALLNSKGGCAKTTSAVFLAQVAHNRGLGAEIWDMDPQASATQWATVADLPFPVAAANIASLKKTEGEKVVFIDTPPGNPQIISEAARASDLAIIPTNASLSDMDRTWATIDALKNEVPVAVLVTAAETNTRVYQGLVEALEEAGVALLPPVRKRAMFREAFGERPTKFWGYDSVFTEIQDALEV